jgi:phospholipase/lecithinase/hemolysin
VITEFYPAYAAAASELASYYNALLVSSVAAEASRDSLNLHILDTYALLDAAVADPAKFGFINATDPCWTGDFLGQNGTECADPSRYLFWDHYHATTAANRIIATEAEAALNAVPEPGSLALLLSAVLLMGVQSAARRYRR